MPKYSTEIRKVFETTYVKVFLADNNDLPEIQTRLKALQSVKSVSISNNNRDLTIYPKPPYDATETMGYVETALSAFPRQLTILQDPETAGRFPAASMYQRWARVLFGV